MHGLAKVLPQILILAPFFFIIPHQGLKSLFQGHTSTHFVRRSKNGFFVGWIVFGLMGGV